MITDVSQLDSNGTNGSTNGMHTYADYTHLRLEESVELIKGKLYRTAPAPKRAHQAAISHLLVDISLYLGDKLCEIYTAPFEVRLPIRNERKHTQVLNVVQPDICVIADKSKLDDDGCLGPPDWIIEVTSPRTAKNDFNEKFNLYEEAGVREYWIVQPKEQAINVYVLENRQYALVDVFESGDIRSQIFPNLLISHGRIFR